MIVDGSIDEDERLTKISISPKQFQSKSKSKTKKKLRCVLWDSMSDYIGFLMIFKVIRVIKINPMAQND